MSTRIIIKLVLILLSTYCTGQKDNFLVEGNLSNVKDGDTIYLVKGQDISDYIKKREVLDSAIVIGGRFNFGTSISIPNYQLIVLSDYRSCTIIAEPNKKISITGDANNLDMADIKGSLDNEIKSRYSKDIIHLISQMNSYADSAASSKIDTALRQYYFLQNNNWANKIREKNINIIRETPNSFLALDKMRYYHSSFSKKEVKDFLDALPESLKNHAMAHEIYYNKFQKEIDIKKINKFYDFTFLDTSGQQLDFKGYYGNIVLVDFWASWCKPCIANIPKLDSLYNKYKAKNFKILSISIDETKEYWQRGIKLAPTKWANVSDLKGLGGLAVEYYKVESIPRYLLLNTDGSLISDDINIPELDTILYNYIFR